MVPRSSGLEKLTLVFDEAINVPQFLGGAILLEASNQGLFDETIAAFLNRRLIGEWKIWFSSNFSDRSFSSNFLDRSAADHGRYPTASVVAVRPSGGFALSVNMRR